MQIPSIVRKIGRVNGECRIYIEDYVYSFLKELRTESSILPRRVALYGHVYNRDDKCYYFVYGAADVYTELESNRTQEQIKEEFFEKHDLIGFVNLYEDGFGEHKGGYYVFYEANEDMQNYLLHIYAKKNEFIIQEKEQKEEELLLKSLQDYVKAPSFGELTKWFMYGISMLTMAVAATTIDSYEKMLGFTRIMIQAVRMLE